VSAAATPALRLGLIGWPVAHSLSPQIHRAAMQAVGLAGEYRLYPVDPAHLQPALDDLLNRVRAGEIAGLNVTVPHKERLRDHVDQCSETALAIGAVNTLVFQDGCLRGENSDAPGFLSHLQQAELLPSQRRLRCAILGAGGAARAVAYALATAGHSVGIVARRESQAQRLAADLSQAPGVLTPPASLPPDFNWLREGFRPDLLVNATPVGMHPNPAQSPWPLEIPLPKSCLVYDLVYNPTETLLLRQARRAGLPTLSGLGMLVEQAALSFAWWTGIQPPLEALYQAVGLPL